MAYALLNITFLYSSAEVVEVLINDVLGTGEWAVLVRMMMGHACIRYHQD